MLILSLGSLGNGYTVAVISYRQTSTCRPRHTVYVIVVVFVYLYARTTLAWGTYRPVGHGRWIYVLE